MPNHATPLHWGDTFDTAVVYHLAQPFDLFSAARYLSARSFDVAADSICVHTAAQHHTLLPRLRRSQSQLQLCRMCVVMGPFQYLYNYYS